MGVVISLLVIVNGLLDATHDNSGLVTIGAAIAGLSIVAGGIGLMRHAK
jgi:hypothetical protein